MSSMLTILEVKAIMAKYTKGLAQVGCYRQPKYVVNVVVFRDKHGILRVANTTSSKTELELPRHSLISDFADDLAHPSSLKLYTNIANDCRVEFIDMVEIADTVYPIYLVTGRVCVSGHCVNLTFGEPGFFITREYTKIKMGPIAAALFNRRV